MRLSVRTGDKGFNPIAHQCSVRIDGELNMRVVTADEELGYALAYKEDEDGNLTVDPDTHEVVTEELHGKVEILIPVSLTDMDLP